MGFVSSAKNRRLFPALTWSPISVRPQISGGEVARVFTWIEQYGETSSVVEQRLYRLVLVEANAPVPENAKFNQGDKVRIHIEKALPREDVLKIQILDTPPR